MAYVMHVRASALFFLLPLFSNAQQTDSSGVVSFPEKRLEEVVVQATRVGKNSPIPHNNLTAEKITQLLQAQDVPMLLSGIPSLVESSDAGTGIGYTGLRIRGSDPTRVNVTINGVPLNDAESQSVYWVNLPDLAASAAEIQVQRGVGTSSNGAGAFGATVNVDLSKVSPEPAASILSTFGAFNTQKFAAQMNSGLLSGKWAFSGRMSRIYSNGYVDRATAALGSVHLSAAYLGDKQTVQVHLLSGHETTYQAWNGAPAQFIDLKNLRTFNSAGAERPGHPYDQEVDDYTQRHLLLHYKRTLSSQLLLQLNGHYTQGAGYYEQYKAGQNYADYGLAPWAIGDSTVSATDLIRRRWLDNDFYGGTFALRWQPKEATSTNLLLGGAISRYDGAHFGEIIWSEYPVGQPKGFRYYENQAEKHDANLYLKAEKKFMQKLNAFVDVQGRAVDYQFVGFNNNLLPTDQSVKHFFLNPKMGATYAYAQKWSMYAYVGMAHREPNRDDYTQSSPTSRPKAERLVDTECGVRFEGHHTTASANFFLMKYRDQLVLDGRINDVGAYTRTNVPFSHRVGLELEFSSILGTLFSVVGNVSVSQNKIKQFTEYRDNWDTYQQEIVTYRNRDLAFSPKVTSRVEVSCLLWKNRGISTKVEHQKQQVSATIAGKYVGKQFLDNTSNDLAVLPGYFVSDIRVNVGGTRVLGNPISLIVSVNNWLNARYVSNGWVYRYVSAGHDARPNDPYTRLEGGAVYHQAGFFPQAGIHWMASFRMDF